MKTRFGGFLAVLAFAFAAPILGGCGGAYYAIHVSSASGKVEEAKAQGAEQLAPYEYYYAKEHLYQAQVEAAEASYSDAAEYAEVAEEYANKAIELSRAAHKASPRP